MPPVRVTGVLGEPLQTQVLTIEPIKRQIRRVRDLIPFIGSSDESGRK
jgi:hypothetical protein